MRAKHDYGCEIMALIVLTALSAFSHFWYIMIAICAVAIVVGTGVVLSRIFLHAQREMLAHLLSQASRKDAKHEKQVSVGAAASQSLPAA